MEIGDYEKSPRIWNDFQIGASPRAKHHIQLSRDYQLIANTDQYLKHFKYLLNFSPRDKDGGYHIDHFISAFRTILNP